MGKSNDYDYNFQRLFIIVEWNLLIILVWNKKHYKEVLKFDWWGTYI